MNPRAFTNVRNLMGTALTFRAGKHRERCTEDFNRDTIPIKFAFTA